MCEFSCDRDFESCFTTIPEIRAQLLMAAEPNICEGRLIPLTGGSWVVAALDGPYILASKLPNIFKFVPKWRHFTSSSNSSAPSFSLALSIWGLTDSSKKRDNPISPFLPVVEHQKNLVTRYPCKEGQWRTLLGRLGSAWKYVAVKIFLLVPALEYTRSRDIWAYTQSTSVFVLFCAETQFNNIW